MEAWQHEVVTSLRDISDIEAQRRSMLAAENAEIILDPVDLMCQLFDDTGLGDKLGAGIAFFSEDRCLAGGSGSPGRSREVRSAQSPAVGGPRLAGRRVEGEGDSPRDGAPRRRRVMLIEDRLVVAPSAWESISEPELAHSTLSGRHCTNLIPRCFPCDRRITHATQSFARTELREQRASLAVQRMFPDMRSVHIPTLLPS